MAIGQMLTTLFVFFNVINLSCPYKYKYAHKNYDKWSIDLMGYEKDANGRYPLVIGKKYGSIFLACEVNKIDPVKIQWLRNKKQISFPPPYSLHWKKGSVLMVRPLIYGRTDGLYECIVSNGYVSLRKGVNVTIREINKLPKGFPQITAHPGHVRTLRNNVDFHCIVTGFAPMEIVWFHNRVPLSDSSAYNVSPTTNIGHKYSSNLMIKNVTKETKGFYQCIAMNSIGHAVSKQGNIQFRGENWPSRFVRSVLNSVQCSFPLNSSDYQFSLSVASSCKFIRSKEVYLEFLWEPEMAVSISKYSVTIQSSNILKCWSLPKTLTSFVFDKDKGFEASVLQYNVTVLAITDNDVVIGKGEVITDKCPADISIHTLPNVPPLEIGSNFTFECKYEGRPEPLIYWMFTTDIRSCSDLDLLLNSSHVIISQDKRTVNLVHVTKKQEGCYVCKVGNELSEDDSKGYLQVKINKKSDKNVVAPAIGGMIGGLLFLFVFFMVYKYHIRPKPYSPDPIKDESLTVYISHCTKSERKEMKLLRFADLLQKEYGIKVIMDLTSNIEINQVGGMFLWLPQAMQRANKIIVVLSKDYIDTLKNDNDDEMACKVHAEYRSLNNVIYRDCYRSHRLVIISDSVNPIEFPDSLNGRSYFEFPKCIEPNDIDVNRIVGVLFNQEMIQLQEPKISIR